MNIKATVKGQAVTLGSFYLSDAKLAKLGQECTCMNSECQATFQAGIPEYFKALQDDKFRPKRKLEIFTVGSEGLYPDEVKVAEVTLEEVTLQARAIMFGLQDFNYRFCPSCAERNKGAFEYLSSSPRQQSYNNSHTGE
jgi:hypothetical protein